MVQTGSCRKKMFKQLKLLIHKTKPRDPFVNMRCHEFEVNNWIVSEFIIDKLLPVVGFHPFPINEQMLMVATVCRLKPTHIFEWGTNVGKSARIFHETCSGFSIKTEIHSIDLPDDINHIEHPKNERGKFVKGIKEVTLHRGDGVKTALQIISECKDNAARPLFFLDGDHSYESVKNELSKIITCVPQANILLHDTFYQSEESGYNVGPYKAIKEVLSTTPNNFKVFSQNLGLPGMTLLWQN